MTKRSTIKKLASATVNDPRWAALIGRDSSADGRFYYSVKTTGVYCRPSCAARPARPENVQFHLTCEDAEKAGCRPCKRCKPNQAGMPCARTELEAWPKDHQVGSILGMLLARIDLCPFLSDS